jgi:hypothetical protein
MENGMEICDINEKKITSSHINFHATSRKRKRCPTRYQYQTMLVLMNSNTTGVVSEAVTVYLPVRRSRVHLRLFVGFVLMNL